MRGDQESEAIEVEGEVLAEEEAEPGYEAEAEIHVLARRQEPSLPVLREDVRTAALAVAGGALAGAATVAAVRAVGRGGRKSERKLGRRRRNENVVASRSFLVDVHVLGR